MDSILKTVRQHVVGYDAANPAFDPQLIDHINAALWRLNQLNVGTNDFHVVDDTETWADFMGSDTKNVSIVKTFVCDSVRLNFDPPTNSFTLKAIQDRIEKNEWLLNVEVDPEYE